MCWRWWEHISWRVRSCVIILLPGQGQRWLELSLGRECYKLLLVCAPALMNISIEIESNNQILWFLFQVSSYGSEMSVTGDWEESRYFIFFFKILKATKQLTLEQELLKEELSLLSHLTPLNIHDTDLHSRLNVNLIFFESYSTIWNYDSPLKHCGKMQNHKILSIIRRDSRLNLKYLWACL